MKNRFVAHLLNYLTPLLNFWTHMLDVVHRQYISQPGMQRISDHFCYIIFDGGLSYFQLTA